MQNNAAIFNCESGVIHLDQSQLSSLLYWVSININIMHMQEEMLSLMAQNILITHDSTYICFGIVLIMSCPALQLFYISAYLTV